MISIGSENNFILNNKMVEIGNFLVGNQAYSYENLDGRLDRALISIHSFVENPIIGNGVYTGYNSKTEVGIIGQHSEWFDALARYGIIGFILFIKFLFYSIKDIYKKNSRQNLIILIFILLGFVNPVMNFTVIFVMFFVGRVLYEIDGVKK